jgi:hypothetical protein
MLNNRPDMFSKSTDVYANLQMFSKSTSKSTFNGIHPEDTINIPEDTSKNSKVFCEIEKYSDGNLIIF